MQTRSLPCDWPGVGSPGSRATSFHTCQVLRPRRVLQALALNAPVCIAFRLRNGVSTRNMNLCGAQWLAYVLLCRRFAAAFAGDRARLGVDVDRYSFITDYSLPVSRRTAKDSGHYQGIAENGERA